MFKDNDFYKICGKRKENSLSLHRSKTFKDKQVKEISKDIDKNSDAMELFEFSDTNQYYDTKDVIENKSFWAAATRKLLKQKLTLISIVFILLLIVLSFTMPFIYSESAYIQNLEIKNLPPKIPFLEKMGILNGFRYGRDIYAEKGVNGYFYFGTDDLGRDIFSRLWFGIRTSLSLAFIITSIQVIVGSIVGGISGYFGGRVDNIIQRICEILGNIPTLIVVLIISLVLKSSVFTLIIALSLLDWIPFSRLVRAQILTYKNKEFVLASKALGAGSYRIITIDLLPNMLSTFIISICMQLPALILAEAYYTFIGVGLPVGVISLGQLIVENVGKFAVYPYQLYIPTVFMALISLSFNILGNGLRDALDPKQIEVK